MDSEPIPADVQRLLVQRVGLRMAETDWAKASRLLRARAGKRHTSLAAYCSSLSEEELAREMDTLAACLTPGETFFFRDHGQFELLRCRLLPELIEARRKQRTLRLWSAGCSSGEEAYSLAMVVDMVLPQRAGWRITIVGSDINGESLAKAGRARYGKWSFRMAPASLQTRYFRQEGEEWILNDNIRSMVTLRPGNLVSNPLPDAVCREMDLILCRNVLIYLSPEAGGIVTGKLAACLADGGYLMTGHTELMGQEPVELRSRLFLEGVVYQRADKQSDKLPDKWADKRPTPLPGPLAARGVSATIPLRGSVSPRRERPAGVATGNRERPPSIAQALADRGDYRAAESACRRAMEVEPMASEPHFLLAQLAQLKGDYREAELQLNQTLYLCPEHIAAYLELAALHERAGQAQRALARRRTALKLLRRLPADARVEPFEVSAGQLANWLEQTEAL